MPKISQSLGFTFRLGGEKSNEFCRLNVEISEIDTDLPIEPQLEKTGEGIVQIWKFLLKKIDAEIDEVLDR